MKIITKKLGMAQYLTPDGPLTDDSLPVIKDVVRKMQDDGSVNLVIDLVQVSFISSLVLEFMLDLSSDLRQASGSLRLAGPSNTCSEIFAMTKLDKSIPIFDDLESAGRSFL